MKILITGAGGQVGLELQQAKWPEGIELLAYSHHEFDIADEGAIEWKITPSIGLVVNAAAYTAVDRAETDREATSRINALAPRLIAQRCAALNIPLVHVSTDYVFDGSKGAPYVEDDPTTPLNHYGATKLEGERAVRAATKRHVILRTASVFSAHGTNFVKTMIRLARERSSLKIVSDQASSPTAASDIAEAIVRIAHRIRSRSGGELWGTYHFCGGPGVTWYNFAQAIFDVAGRRGVPAPELEPIPADQYPTTAKRPRFSIMDCSKIQRIMHIDTPLWDARLPSVVDAIVGR